MTLLLLNPLRSIKFLILKYHFEESETFLDSEVGEAFNIKAYFKLAVMCLLA